MNFKALIGFLALSISTSTVAQIEIENARVRAMPPAQKVTAAYLSIANNTAETRTLVGASSAVTSHIEIHQNLIEDGVMKMRQIDGLDIPAHGSASLEANGKHLMMFNLNKDLTEGESIMLWLEFDDGSKQGVMAMVTKMLGMKHGESMKQGESIKQGDDMAKDMETGMQKVTPTKAEIHLD